MSGRKLGGYRQTDETLHYKPHRTRRSAGKQHGRLHIHARKKQLGLGQNM